MQTTFSKSSQEVLHVLEVITNIGSLEVSILVGS